MKKYIFIIVCILCSGFSFGAQELIDKNIDWHNIKVVKVTLDGNYFVVSSISHSWESLWSLINKVWWKSGINGSYFAPVDYWNSQNIAKNERIFNWKRYFPNIQGDFWARGLFWFDKNGDSSLILNNFGYVNGINKRFNTDKLNNILYGISNYPVLLIDGKNVVDESDFPDIIWDKLKKIGVKSFICNTENKIFFWYISDINIYDFPDFLIDKFWCENAINLDAWGSLGLVYNSKQIKKEGRNIMDAFVVVDKQSYYKLLKQNWVLLSNFAPSDVENSYNFFYDNKLTKLDLNTTDLNIGSTRRETAILLNRFISFIWIKQYTNNICAFKDVNLLDKEIKDNIIMSCKNWLFKWNAIWYFLPYSNITKWEFLIVVTRLIKNDPSIELDSSYQYLISQWIINYSKEDLWKDLTRSDIYVILFSIYNKYYK